TDSVTGRENRLANELLINSCENPQQRAFARTVQADDAYLRAVEVGEVNIFKDRLLVVILSDADHRVDNFIGNSAHLLIVDHRCCAGEGQSAKVTSLPEQCEAALGLPANHDLIIAQLLRSHLLLEGSQGKNEKLTGDANQQQTNLEASSRSGWSLLRSGL